MDKFSAVTACPKCKTLDIHRFRLPKEIPADYEPGVIKRVQASGVVHRVESWGMPDEYAMERNCEVIRQCKCGNEWPNR